MKNGLVMMRVGEWGEVVRHTTIKGGQGTFFPPVLKVPRQCPLALLVEVRLGEGKVLGSEKE
jgi:hypothetical protein